MSLARSVASTGTSRRLSGLPGCAAIARPSVKLMGPRREREQRCWASTSADAPSSSDTSLPPLAPRLPPGATNQALPSRMKPLSPSFYTGKPLYMDSMILLDDLERRAKRALQQASLPIHLNVTKSSINGARKSIKWPSVDEMSSKMGTKLKINKYRHVIVRLSALIVYRYFMQEYFLSGQYGEQNRRLAESVMLTLQDYGVKASGRANRWTKPHASFLSASSGVDDLGRAYARGRRKESSARVWLVPALDPMENRAGLPNATVSTSILINAQSISAYFTRASDREAILFPLRATGLAGVFNIFTLVRGGGTSGQTGAIAHGIARALITFFDDKARTMEKAEGPKSSTAESFRQQAHNIKLLLRRTGASWRDPRSVERKKTGKAKSRKSYTWVKR